MSLAWYTLPIKLSQNTVKAIEKLGFSEPLPVQKSVIPLLLASKDVVAEAVTGSGKTLAFVVPIIELLLKRSRPWDVCEIGALILSPTYELARQIYEIITHFLEFYPDSNGNPKFSSLVFTGGGRSGGQTNKLQDFINFQEKGSTILVATPGRLADLIRTGPLVDTGSGSIANPIIRGLRSVDVLILDEADRLLEMGFESQINTVLSFLPKQRRTGLFSATQTNRIEDLVRAGLRNPVRVVVSEQTNQTDKFMATPQQRTPIGLFNYYTIVEPDEKLSIILRFIFAHLNEKLLIFFATCACVDYFYHIFKHILPKKRSKLLYKLHGKLNRKRFSVFDHFRHQSSGILLCTDVMARGVDIPQVHWVVQCDPPTSATAFVHRCGRTARCGIEGNALLLVTPEESAYINFLRINQNVDLNELIQDELIKFLIPFNSSFTPSSITQRIRSLSQKDKLVHERSIRAFVSYVQFYRKHECHLLLNYKKLDFGRLANGFGLLCLPKMPELRTGNISAFDAPNIDLSKITYSDKSVAKQRKLIQSEEILKQNKKDKLTRKQRNKIWIEKKRKKRQIKLCKNKKNKQFSSIDLSNKSQIIDESDVKEILDDYRILKKALKGKVSEPDLQFEDQADSETM